MKKIVSILYFVFVILLSHLTKNENIFLLTISYSMSLIFFSVLSTINIKTLLEDYQNKKKYYLRDRLFKNTLLVITIIIILMMGLSYLISIIFGIDKLFVVNIVMCIYVFVNVIAKITNEYLEVLGYKKLTFFLLNIHNIGSIILAIIISVLCFKVFEIDTYISIILLYLSSVISFIILMIPIIILLVKRGKVKKEIKNKSLYLKELKKIFIENKVNTIYNIVKYTYLYVSIIILYYVLINKYNYNFDEVGINITNIYFYGIIIIYYIYILVNKIYNKDLELLKNKINNKEEQLSNNFNNLISKVIRVSLSIIITLLIISGPLSNILLNSSYNVLFNLILMLFFYILYDIIIKINIMCSSKKQILITIFLGLLFKIAFELPLINSIYRMGYNLTFGSILSTILGMIISIITGIIFIKNKLKITLHDNFSNILNIINENIILCFILVLFTFIIKVETISILSSIFTIIFYVFITVLFYIVKGVISKKRVR